MTQDLFGFDLARELLDGYVYLRYHTNEDGTVTVTHIPPEQWRAKGWFRIVDDPHNDARPCVREPEAFKPMPPRVDGRSVAEVVQAAIRQASGLTSVQPGGLPLMSLGPPGDFLKIPPRG